MKPIVCPNCKIEVKQLQYDQHLDEECTEKEILCIFSENGCGWRVIIIVYLFTIDRLLILV